jgi:dsDNA-binding SOS-regulon protein
MKLAVLWSALSMFGPGFDDPPDIGLRWQRWVRWLRSRRISGVPGGTSSVDLISTWRRLQRLERSRWRRTFAGVENRFMRSPDESVSRGLDTGFLDRFFGWLLADSSRPNGEELEIGRQVLMALWSYEAAYCSERRDEDGEYHVPYQFAYNVLAKLAFYSAHVQADRAAEIWRGVLELGPAARYLLQHFVSTWFIQLSHGCDSTTFCTRWRDMIEFALDDKWHEGGHWFYKQQMLRRLLGFGSVASLTNLPDAAQTVLDMRDLYHRWARANLQREEENVAAFSVFLASEVGAALRTEGVKWLATSFKDATREQYWRHQSGTGSALVDLLDTTLQENTSVLRRDQETRDALVALAAQCTARQVPAALALQERIKNLR